MPFDLTQSSLHLIFLLVLPGLMLKIGLEGRKAVITLNEQGIRELFLLSVLYLFLIGPSFLLLTMPLISHWLDIQSLTSLIILLGPQLGPLAEPMFTLLLSGKDTATASEFMHSLSTLNVRDAASKLAEMFPNETFSVDWSEGAPFTVYFLLRYGFWTLVPLVSGLIIRLVPRFWVLNSAVTADYKTSDLKILKDKITQIEARQNKIEAHLKESDSSNTISL